MNSASVGPRSAQAISVRVSRVRPMPATSSASFESPFHSVLDGSYSRAPAGPAAAQTSRPKSAREPFPTTKSYYINWSMPRKDPLGETVSHLRSQRTRGQGYLAQRGGQVLPGGQRQDH